MLLTNIKALFGNHLSNIPLRGKELGKLPSIENAYIRIKGEHIEDFGSMKAINLADEKDEVIDLKGKYVLPSFCDSHTHIVYAGSRESEFVDKINGLGYAEIAAKGGGILNSAERLANTSEDELFESAMQRVLEVQQLGTGALEIKSGYGLSVEAELKMLRVIKRIKESVKMPIKATFLGAHAYPKQFKDDHEAYHELIISEMLPAIADENLADYIDVFCEKGFFDEESSEKILEAGASHGLKAKIHANQLHNSGGVQLGVKLGALSVDHLETLGDKEIKLLGSSNIMSTMLPSAAFFLRMQYPPARELIEANAALALATDYNPGSSPSGNIPLLISLACIQMKMTPEEAVNAATLNGAIAMEIENEAGSIMNGKLANLIVTKEIPSLAFMPYAFGSQSIDKVMLAGEWI
ncbi:imidazolonepropionase [Marivirga atlantica]|jgi:imidazolonepropionase|uniref:Imidazolonepropionase n=1 Tax=Marivirga atlantica TaxID=1548457 RepID=A0A937ALY8_9BACT|nr:imidazolonepropionase [Marivirga atlantica]MBL0765132.1 imidazolonepropionase [Marivirga atlantica]